MSGGEPEGCYDIAEGAGGEHTCLLDAGHDRPGPHQEDHTCTCGATWPPAAALTPPERRSGPSG